MKGEKRRDKWKRKRHKRYLEKKLEHDLLKAEVYLATLEANLHMETLRLAKKRKPKYIG